MIKLYHGTNTTFDKVELDKCLPYKDFGRGFYLTTLRTQALARAKNKCNFEQKYEIGKSFKKTTIYQRQK